MKADYVMVGGFLGAGKTTALLRLAEHFTSQGRRVGLITNDQSLGLVDTSLATAKGYPVEEITGGCFCCRFDSLTEAADRLTEAARPEVFLAEPVGSCTDLRATVQYPLRRLYGDDYRVAPLSVLVDPLRAERMLGLKDGRHFSAKVNYIYDRQLEEADIIVVNKSDLLDGQRRETLEGALKTRYPHTAVVTVSARTGADLEQWLERLSGSLMNRHAMDVDYDTYAEGEALLGWLNATCRLSSPHSFDGNRLLSRLAERVHLGLACDGIEIAHFKMTLAPSTGSDLAVINLVGTDGRAESVHQLAEDLTAGELILNLRAEGDPQHLRTTAVAALETVCTDSNIVATIAHIDSFRPGRPEPTHRMVTA
jgi:G3E family GTPase